MSEENNKQVPKNNQPVPRVVKGTGFYTPMDLAPGENPPQPSEPKSVPVREMTGLPTAMHVEPPQPSNEPSQAGQGDSDAKNN